MARLVHLSDLHFGRDRPELIGPLADAVNRLRADVVAISGDLTQRARRAQFAAAARFVARLEAPVVAVPGNHDVPLYNLAARLVRPYANYRRAMGRDLEPVFEGAGLTVAGLNTVDPHVWQRGIARAEAIGRVCERFRAAPRGNIRIVVAHHPFEQTADDEKTPMKDAAVAIDRLSECGTDIVLCGHLHTWRAGLFTQPVGRRGTLQVQAGTGLSTRLRGEENDFNLLVIEDDELLIERYACPGTATAFRPDRQSRFQLGQAGWVLPESGASPRPRGQSAARA